MLTETGNQEAQYLYGATLANSEIASSQLLREVIYPDSASGTDRVKHRYIRQGEVIETTDQNQTERAFNYDLLGRRTQDRIVTLGSGVDGAVRRIETAYNKQGEVERIEYTPYGWPQFLLTFALKSRGGAPGSAIGFLGRLVIFSSRQHSRVVVSVRRTL